MELTSDVEQQLEAVRAGCAFAAAESRVFEVAGPDAQKWLNDLVTAGVHSLEVGDSCESLLLDATGRIKCHFLVGRSAEETYILVQSADQSQSVGELLSRYVLSSKVTLAGLSDDLAVFRVPSMSAVTASWTFADMTSSVVGFPAADTEAIIASLPAESVEAPFGFEADRIQAGRPRFPLDFAETSLPAEAGWDDWMVDAQKGCFLGQESVAKIRNRGRPPFLVLGLQTEARAEAGDPVLLDGAESGLVTSALSGPDGSALIARVRWFGEDAPDLRGRDGAAFRPLD